MSKRGSAAREFLTAAQRFEARAKVAAPGHAAQLEQKARDLRAAARRIAEREALERGELPLG